ncbi:FadD3 family acyl-CoA ligase [Phytohabitans sp. LJ34]|uniref:FadD3 family acyl-CoA ligase n=1 Tax=Phytohabitans sp. LJ34 TaxID=3452217 RepID=UPI003F8BB871
MAVDPTAARTLPALVRAAAEAHPDREAVVDGDTRVTFERLAVEVERAAAALVASGVRAGDRVAIWAPNSWRWLVAALGVAGAGAVLVPLNTRYKGPEAGYILDRTRAKLLFTQDGFLGIPYRSMAAERGGEVVDFADWDAFVGRGSTQDVRAARECAAAVTPDDVCDIFFTSGTTGHPKGAMLGHGQTTRLYVAWSERATLRAGDRQALVNPFFHTFGWKAGVVACLLRGATVAPLPVFDVAATMSLIERERITVLPGPPTLYTSILDHPERARFDLSSLRVAVTGATTVPVVMVERLHAELGLRTVVTAYGLTESCGTATMCRPDDDPATVAATSGGPVPGVEVRVVGANGVPQGPGQPGEVQIRGYNVTRGYFEDEPATAAAVDPDGWLRTGDIGVLDERGYLRITDRLKDMFIVGGFNAYPAEIEQVVVRHPGVAEAAVIGVPDERLGEVGRAFVVPRPGAAGDLAAELIEYCRANLANYKVPRSVVLVAALPRNASGKVMKAALRESS